MKQWGKLFLIGRVPLFSKEPPCNGHVFQFSADINQLIHRISASNRSGLDSANSGKKYVASWRKLWISVATFTTYIIEKDAAFEMRWNVHDPK